MRATHERSTVLELGARGRLDGAPFTLTGRTCIEGGRGTIWNEWRMRFGDPRPRFLVESTGTFTVYEEGSLAPGFGELTVGDPLDTGFVVVERGEARRVATWGEADAAPARYAYADLSSRSGAVAAIDFGPVAEGALAGVAGASGAGSAARALTDGAGASERPRVYVGRRVTLAALGLSVTAREPPWLVAAPDVSRPRGVETWLDVGDEGVLDGVRFRVAGALSRRLVAEARVAWDEYLLYAPELGLRWLVVVAGHWSLVEPVDPGRVVTSDGAATLDGTVYDAQPEATARVAWATGALPWRVEIGETARVTDFVHGASMLTRERTTDTLAWSRGVRVAPGAVAAAFAKRSLPKPAGHDPSAP
ncbi:MAG: DUF4178 domain-containing protein [Labilithrix sp.]|nr:DUF4178 domain-containing protein [Labilithrix sp.]